MLGTLAAFSAMLLGGVMATDEGVKPTVADLGWFEGRWVCDKWGGEFEEHWTSTRGGSLLGMGRHISDGKTGFMEFISIEPEKDGTLVMFITLGSPSNADRRTAQFRLTSLKDKVAVFEDPTNDFPSRVTYSIKDGSLFCLLEGEQNGKPMKDEFAFKRIASDKR